MPARKRTRALFCQRNSNRVCVSSLATAIKSNDLARVTTAVNVDNGKSPPTNMLKLLTAEVGPQFRGPFHRGSLSLFLFAALESTAPVLNFLLSKLELHDIRHLQHRTLGGGVIVKRLLEAGHLAQLQVVLSYGWPIRIADVARAIQLGHAAFTAQHMAPHIDVGCATIQSLLGCGSDAVFRAFLQHHPTAPGSIVENASLYACYCAAHGTPDIMRTLLAVKVAPDTPRYGVVPLGTARSSEMATALLDCKASPHHNTATNTMVDNTPIFHAVQHHWPDVVERLLTHKADVSIPTKDGCVDTPLRYSKTAQMARRLLEAKAVVHAAGPRHRNPLGVVCDNVLVGEATMDTARVVVAAAHRSIKLNPWKRNLQLILWHCSKDTNKLKRITSDVARCVLGRMLAQEPTVFGVTRDDVRAATYAPQELVARVLSLLK